MTTLFDGNVSFPAGDFTSPGFKVSKKLDGVTSLTLLVESAAFPAGRTTLNIQFSFDGGLTYPPEKSAQMTVDGPIPSDPKVPVFQDMTFTLNGTPTHARYSSNAPSAFTAHVIVLG